VSGLGRLAPLPGLPRGHLRERYAREQETPFRRQIEETAARYRRLCFHDQDGHYCPQCGAFRKDSRRPGFPDLVIAAAPVLALVEVKTMRGRLSEEQEHWLADVAACRYLLTDVWRPDQSQLIAEFLADPEGWVRRAPAAPERSGPGAQTV
jgi:hypothetical protein